MLYQQSRKTYNNLYTSSRGYKIGKSLEFANNKIEKRYLKGAYIQNIQSILYTHIAQLVLCALDCLVEKQNPQYTYIQIAFLFIFLKQIKKAKSEVSLKVMSFALQIYFFFRFSELKLPFEFHMLLFTIWGINHVISWKQMALIYSCIYITLSEVFHQKESFFWNTILSMNGQRQIYSFEVLFQNYALKVSEIEFEFIFLSTFVYYLCQLMIRQNWRVLDQTKRSERAYVNLFQKNITPTFIVNHQGNILELNEESKKILGESRVSSASSSFFKLIQDKQELANIKQAFEQATLTKETINIRANIIIQSSSNSEYEARGSFNTIKLNKVSNDNDNQQNEGSKSNSNIGGETNSNSNTKNGINMQSTNKRTNEITSKNISSPPVRHSQQIAPPQLSKNAIIQKIPYPFLSEQFDDLLKDEYLDITDNELKTKYYLVSISPYIWKENASFLINLIDISETKNFVKISNFFMRQIVKNIWKNLQFYNNFFQNIRNLNERLVSVLSLAEEDYQKWSNLVQVSQIKQTDLRELSAVISEQHNILSLTSLLRNLNQLYIGHEKGKPQDFQITNLIIQTIEVHSVRVQNYVKKMDLVFESFPPQVNGDPNAFYFIIHNLIYLMTYNCEYNDVDLSINCSFKTYVDRSSSLVLSFEFDLMATQEQIEFFTRITKKFEDLKRLIVQNDLIGHDILETLYLLTLNSIKQNDGQIFIEVNDAHKQNNEQNQQNQPQSQQSIVPPQSSQQIIKETTDKNKQNPIESFKNENKQDQNAKTSQVKRINIVLEQIFNTAEMHTVKRQGQNSIMDSPATAPSTDQKGTIRKYHALSKPPQINLSYTSFLNFEKQRLEGVQRQNIFKEKQKDKFQWKQCKEEEKKIQAQMGQIGLQTMRRPEIQKVRNFQNFGTDSDESIPQPVQRTDSTISPIPIKQPNRKQSTVQSLILNEEKQLSNNCQNSQQTSIQNIPQASNYNSQVLPTTQKEISQQQISQNPVNTKQQLPQANTSLNIASKKLENISENDEIIDNHLSNNHKFNLAQKTETESTEVNSDINDFLSEENNNYQMQNTLKKEIKTYLKLYNQNIIKDLSKIFKNILSNPKIQEEYDLRFKDKSSKSYLDLPNNIPKFCSPQITSTKMNTRNYVKPSNNIHQAFKEYVNPQKIVQNQEIINHAKNILQRKESVLNEDTPKSLVVSNRQSRMPSLVTMSPLIVNNFRFKGESNLNSTIQKSNKEANQIPWNQIIPFQVHQSRLKQHVRKWTLQDLWNKLYKKTDTVLVVSYDFDDMSMMKQIFQQKKDLGRDLDFSKMTQAFDKYMQYLKDSQVYKYCLIDLRLNLNDIQNFINQVKVQEGQSKTIPKALFVGYNSQQHFSYDFHLDFVVDGKCEVLSLLPFLKILKEKK